MPNGLEGRAFICYLLYLWIKEVLDTVVELQSASTPQDWANRANSDWIKQVFEFFTKSPISQYTVKQLMQWANVQQRPSSVAFCSKNKR